MTNYNDKARPPPQDHAKELLKLIESLSYRHDKWQVFADFNEAAAISLSNAVDLAQREAREARYIELIKRYSKDELQKFPQMLASLVEALEAETDDVLGKTFHALELHNKYSGQFFTPYPVCQMMAKMTLGDKAAIETLLERRGFIRAAEPAAGSGAMIIAMAEALQEEGVNYQRHLHVTAVDVDLKCVHMAYLQMSLMHIPAVIVHGNSLSLEEWSHWYTPAHIMGGWTHRLRRDRAEQSALQEITRIDPRPAPRPERRQDEPASEGPAQLTLF